MKIDPINTQGRRAKEVIQTKVKDMKNAERTSKKQSEARTSNTTTTNTNTNTTTTTTKPKKPRHVTTDEEKSILTPYFNNPNPTDEETKGVLDSLRNISSDYWTKIKVKAAWKYVQDKNKKR